MFRCLRIKLILFSISNFRRVLNVVSFLLGDSPVGTYPPMKMGRTECSEPLAFKLQAPVDHPEESMQQINITSLL
jgi:hypothetical protein